MIDDASVTHASFSRLGGAGAVAVRLAAAQRRLGRQVDLVAQVDSPFPRWAGRHPGIAAAALLDYYVVRRHARASFFSLFRRQHAGALASAFARCPGVVHLHWLPGFLWPPAFFRQPLQARKIVWSIQDLWPFTGGCHYVHDCEEYTRACGRCPQAHGVFQGRIAAALEQKRLALQGRRHLLLVAPSEWTRTLIQASAAMRGLPVAVVPNPVDTRVFVPQDKATVRRKWGLDPGSFLVGVGAADVRDERKQIPQTLAVLRAWMETWGFAAPLQVLVFGAGGPLPGYPPAVRFMGPSKNGALLAEWYNAMDAYVSLSRYETFGNTLAEAAACGIPAVCLTGSGMAEVIIPGQTGRHVQSSGELPGALADWAEVPARGQAVGAEARRQAVLRFDDEIVARQFLALYDEPMP